MPRVPEYTPDVSIRPAYREEAAQVASPEAYGSGVGRGVQQLASGVASMADAARAVQDLEDEARVRDVRNQYIQESDKLAYDPENGYFFTQGRNALDGFKAFQDASRQLREKYARDLSPYQRQMFERATETIDLDRQRQALVHRGKELKNYVVEGSKAAAENFSNEALRHIGNPELANKYLAAGLNELKQVGLRLGLSPDQQEAIERDFLSKNRYSAALMIAQGDPLEAEKYIEQHKDQLTPEHAYELKGKLKPLLIDARATRYAAEWEGKVDAAARSGKVVRLVNQNATRNQPITESLQRKLTDAVVNVYGPGYRAEVYSGGQPAPGKGPRTGSTRHDHGRAADVRVIGPDGKQVSGDALAPLAQYWVAKNYGGVGLEMRGGGIHLDEHTDRALFWNYLKEGGNFTAEQARALAAGLRGELPAVKIQDDRAVPTPDADEAVSGPSSPATIGSDSVAIPGAAPRSGDDLISYLNGIADPDEREATLRKISLNQRLRAEQEKANAEALKAQAFSLIDRGMSPDNLPPAIRTQLGRTEMAGLWEYYEKFASGDRIKTNEFVFSGLLRFATENPEAFMNLDLWNYKSKLSKEDWRKVDELKRKVMTDQFKGVDLMAAFRQADIALAGVGLTTAGLKDEARAEMEKRIARFQTELFREIETFRADPKNGGRGPNQSEIQEIINRLLLPVVIKEERAWYNPLAIFGPAETDGLFMFDAPYRPDGSAVEVRFDYEEIPADLRRVIEVDLERELKRKPSEEEVTARFVEFQTSR